VLPVAPSSGGEVVTRALADALRAGGHDVTVIGFLRPEDPEPAEPWMRVAGRRPIETAAAPRATLARWALRALLRRRAFSEAKYMAYDVPDADLVLVDHAQVGWAARAPYVHVAHNRERDLYDGGGVVHRREARRIDATERALAAGSLEVWTLTRADADAFAALGARTRALAVGVPPAPRPDVARVPGRVALLGTWTWGPNRAGLDWFRAEVVPRLPGDLEVVVGGRGSELGLVPDAAGFLAAAGAIALPTIDGAGLPIKTLDAIASGAPVVATPLALRGIDDPPPGVVVTSDPGRFAAALADAARGPSYPEVGVAWARARADRFAAEVAGAVDWLNGQSVTIRP
jgi:glycosyltransferase involved in cell wall biosynthesis